MRNRICNQQQYWDKIAEGYSDRYHLQSHNAQRKITRKAKMLIAGVGITETDDVLEIGCGTGVFTELLASTGAFINGIDISPEMVRIADAKFKDNQLAWLEVMDAHKIDYPNRSLDVIVGTYILQYLNLSEALPEIKRVLNPGGRIAFIDINTLNPLAFIKTKLPFVKRLLNISKEAASFTPWELRDWFAQYGFTDIEVIPFEFGTRSLNLLEKVPVIRQFAGNLLITAKKVKPGTKYFCLTY